MSPVTRRWLAPPAKDAWVLLLSVLVVLPHLVYLPPAIAVLCGLAWSVDLVLIGRRARLPRVAKIGLVVAVLAALWAGVARSGEVDLGLALVCLVIALKPLETHDRRERRRFALLCYFGALIFFFQESSDLWLPYYALYLVGLTGFLVTVELPQIETAPALKDAFRLLAQALPPALVLFYLFPRLPEPLWQWGGEVERTVTGLPDEVELHTLSALVESEETAFEVQFEGAVPDVPSLYWRGPVYYFTDGRVWDSDYYLVTPMAPERLDRDATASLTARAEETIGYQISQADGSRHWLVALDLPIVETGSGRLTEDYQLVPRRRGGGRSYRMTSALSIQTPPDSEAVYLKALQLPYKPRMARQARLMGAALKAEYAEDPDAARKIIQRVLTLFAEGPFTYAHDVPEYVTNPIDEFLFEDRRGYCTHYAAATTLMLRAAEVPARMIMGYRGGEWERARGVLVVRQKHAHAWLEAWTQAYGWLRVDPTGVIPAERVFARDPVNGQPSAFNERVLARRTGVEELRRFLRPRQASAAAEGTGPEEGAEGGPPEPSGSSLSLAYVAEMAEFLWHAWLKDFDYERQRHLLDGPGGRPAAYGLALAVLTGALLLSLGLVLLRARRRAHDPGRRVQALYQQLRKRLAAAGIEVPPHEPYQSLQSRLIRSGRFDPKQLTEVFAGYERLRYRQHEHQADDRALRRLREQIKELTAKRVAG